MQLVIMSLDRSVKGLSELVRDFRTSMSQMTDRREGSNSTYELSDIISAGFSIFFFQSGSFLGHQRIMEVQQGENNARSMFAVEEIPSDNHIRKIIDAIGSEEIDVLFSHVHEALASQGLLREFMLKSPFLRGQVAIALDGTETVSSYSISCVHCNTREVSCKGTGKDKDKIIKKTQYYHSCIAPVLVVPGCEHVLSLPPEHIANQHNSEKQDCELGAAMRWVEKHIDSTRHLLNLNRMQASATQINLLGDALYAHQPFCTFALEQGLHFILVSKPSANVTLYEEVNLMADQGLLFEHEQTDDAQPAKRLTSRFRFQNDLPLRQGKGALAVNWVEVTITNANGKQVYQNAFITDHPLSTENVAEICQTGRARWKVENENHNTLKTKGYDFEHNFGHGDENLTKNITSLNLLAFLVHTFLHLSDSQYKYLRDKLKNRKTFFEHTRALTTYCYFHSWSDMLLFMIQGLHKRHQMNSS